MISRLIRLGLSDHPSSPVRAKWSVVNHVTFLVARSQTAQLPRSHPQALQVATHSQQVASLEEFYPSAEVQSAYFTPPAD